MDAGLLHIADGLRVQPPSMLVGLITETWGTPAGVVSDRFRVPDLADAGLHGVESRMTRWSESSEDIRALEEDVRRMGLYSRLTLEARLCLRLR